MTLVDIYNESDYYSLMLPISVCTKPSWHIPRSNPMYYTFLMLVFGQSIVCEPEWYRQNYKDEV